LVRLHEGSGKIGREFLSGRRFASR
jgi:hypothetical protein